MKIDVLVAEIGSTTTVVNAFDHLESDNPVFLGQGQAPTSVKEGDVNIGLQAAIEDMKKNLHIENEKLEYTNMLATSSAAGGLRMTVHGLVYDMTVKAAKEAALGAGANIHLITAGKLSKVDMIKLDRIKPNIILIAGGVDYGERETALYNSELIAASDLNIPVIYAGNIAVADDIKLIFESYSKEKNLHIVPNVYPKIDILNIDPTREAIQDIFEKHITEAKGMEKIREMVNGPIIPTPGAVMKASKILKDEIGDLVTIDVGGATTDIHSVTEGTEKVNKILVEPEPVAKRTVEGDLGVFINKKNIVDFIKIEKLEKSDNVKDSSELKGEILVRGENVVDGYLNVEKNPDENWHRTGDMGYINRKGQLILLGRVKGRIQIEDNIYYPFTVETAFSFCKNLKKSVLTSKDDKLYLFAERNPEFKGDLSEDSEIKELKEKFGIFKIIETEIPMDKRHNSKTDYKRLEEIVEKL